jgi:curved DNA-binding protein CbpA
MDFRDWLQEDYYSLLGVSMMSTPVEINKAYKQKAKNCHPDIYPFNSKEWFQAEKKFKQLYQAREILLDPEKRRQYDNERQVIQDLYLASMCNSVYYNVTV